MTGRADTSSTHAGCSPRQRWLRALELTAPIARSPLRTLPLVIQEQATSRAAAPALSSHGSTLSYAELAEACNRYARWGLIAGLRPGDIVGLLLGNCPQYLAIWLGLTRIGVTVALLNTHLQGELLAHSLEVARPRQLLFGGEFSAAVRSLRGLIAPTLELWALGAGHEEAQRLDEAVAQLSGEPLTVAESPLPALEDRALLIYTSGTTGLPKAANVSHFRLMQWSHWFAGLIEASPSDRMYDCLPLYHSVGGIVAPGAILVAGGCVVLREQFSAREFWGDIVRERCTVFQYVGELCRYLVQSPASADETRHQLRLCCGNGLRAEVWSEFKRRFHVPHILEYYAATEGSFSLYNCEERMGALGRIPTFLAHRLTVALIRVDPDTGVPLRDAAGRCIRCTVGEAGEAIGALADDTGARVNRFEGYADAEASRSKVSRDVFTAGDAWYRSGDLMYQDQQGYFYFVDRIGDTYRWKGENVSTSEVAGMLMRCDGVLDATVYGVAVPLADGRAGMAALVVSPSFDLRAFHRHVVASLPEYARPQFLRIVPTLQMTGTLRVRKQELARQGYDPKTTDDELYVLDRHGGRYARIDVPLFEQLRLSGLRDAQA
jgi:fatty-acyl-CoA synthase